MILFSEICSVSWIYVIIQPKTIIRLKMIKNNPSASYGEHVTDYHCPAVDFKWMKNRIQRNQKSQLATGFTLIMASVVSITCYAMASYAQNRLHQQIYNSPIYLIIEKGSFLTAFFSSIAWIYFFCQSLHLQHISSRSRERFVLEQLRVFVEKHGFKRALNSMETLGPNKNS